MGDAFEAPSALVDGAGRAPSVWGWYLVYCGCMVALYALVGAVCAAMPFVAADLAESDQEARVMVVLLPILAVLCALFVLLYAAPFLLGRSPGGYNLGFATIGLGLTGGLTVIPAVFLLMGWLDAKNKAALRGE